MPTRDTDYWWWFSEIKDSIDEHQIVATIHADLEGTPSFPDWRSLLEAATPFDAILMGNCLPEVISDIRELAARGVTLAIPVHEQLPRDLVAELSLYDTEGACTLLPLWLCRLHPRLQDLRHLIRDGRLGEILRIELRVDGAISRSEQWTANSVEQALLSDIDILRMLGGDYSQVLLTRTGVREDQFVTQSLQLSGVGLPDGLSIRDRAAQKPSGRVRVEGVHSTAVFHWGDGKERIDIDGEPAELPIAAPASSHPTLDALDDVALKKPGALRWQDVARAFEIMEATERSLRRRRTIDLHFETTSERSQFKTHMATIGCGVILWTMFGIIGLLFAGAVLDPRERMQIESEAAGFVLTDQDFRADSDVLTDAAAGRLAEIAGRLESSETVVLVTASDADATSPLDSRRLQSVRQNLAHLGVKDVERRTVLRPFKGGLFTRAMQIARVLVFAPVGVYLLLQLLLGLAKPPVNSTAPLGPDQQDA
jgi:myo-inositol 2-dehydrogenase/D-chiro-inositol 1-dehydrogenase